MATLEKPKRRPPAKKRMTVREYMAIPPDQQTDTLLLYGEMIAMPRPRPRHNRATHYLGHVLDRWVFRFDLGTVFFEDDLILSEPDDLVYAPDLMFLAKEHLDRYRDEFVFGPVDLVVEILSPSNRPYLQERKFADYEAFGVPWYWVLDPNPDNPGLREHHLVEGRYQVRREVTGAEWFEPGLFPGLVFRLPQLLAGDLKAAVKGKAKRLM